MMVNAFKLPILIRPVNFWGWHAYYSLFEDIPCPAKHSEVTMPFAWRRLVPVDFLATLG